MLSKDKNFTLNVTTNREGHVMYKAQKQGRDENSRRLSYYRKTVVKKD